MNKEGEDGQLQMSMNQWREGSFVMEIVESSQQAANPFSNHLEIDHTHRKKSTEFEKSWIELLHYIV